MTLYYYKAIDEHGRRVSGEMQADDAASAIAELRGSGRLPISAEPASDRRYFGRLFLRLRSWRSRIRGRDITAITHELATLLNAGIPLDGSLRILERYAQNGMLKIVLSEIHNAVQSGKSLSAAMGMHDTVFDPFSVSLIRAGEASGALAAAVERLADHRERTDEFRANLVSSLTYPIVLVCVSVTDLRDSTLHPPLRRRRCTVTAAHSSRLRCRQADASILVGGYFFGRYCQDGYRSLACDRRQPSKVRCLDAAVTRRW